MTREEIKKKLIEYAALQYGASEEFIKEEYSFVLLSFNQNSPDSYSMTRGKEVPALIENLGAIPYVFYMKEDGEMAKTCDVKKDLKYVPYPSVSTDQEMLDML